MSSASNLAELPLLPRDDEGPVFAEPWQAQAFAAVVELIDTGRISSQEWADKLSTTLKAAEVRGEHDTGLRYYDHWLEALESLAIERNFAEAERLAEEKETLLAGDHHRREDQLSDSQRETDS